MSKEEILKIQTCVLKVNIHCDGCKHKVRKILQKIEGVYTTKIDAEQGKVTVSGTVEAAVLIKKLGKSGKHAELWGAPKANNNNNNNTQLKNMQIDNNNNNKKGGNKGGQKGGNNNQQPKGGQLNPQQLQQLSQMKGFQDLPPQFKDLKMPITNPNQKAVKFNLPEEDEDLSDEFDDDDYYDDDEDDDDDDDEFEDEMDRHPPNKMKPMNMGIGQGGKAPNNISMMMNGMNGQKGENGGGQKIGGEIPVQVMGNGGKKGGNNNNNGGNQKQGGGGGGNGGKNLQAMPVSNIMSGGGGNMGQMMNNMSRPQMGGDQNMAATAAAVQGLPAGVEQQRQQYMAAMMNQQRAMGNERFQPMMYAPPPPAVNYMPPYPYPYPYPYPPPPPPPADPYTHYSSDEDTSICTVM